MSFLDIALHLDKYLAVLVDTTGLWAYGVLFGIIFLEMGCILTPFLPGDSLLFAAGSVAAASELKLSWLMGLLLSATIAGMTINYFIGQYLGHKLLNNQRIKFINPVHLAKTHQFFERHGGKTIIISCFLPIIRTFSPFAAGMAEMPRRWFFVSMLAGSVLWVCGLLWLSFQFGSIPLIKQHFSLIALGVAGISVLPAMVGLMARR